MSKLQKEFTLGAVVILLGVFSWWFLKYVFYIGNLTLGCWISGAILFIIWGIALCLAMLLIDDKRILYGSFIITLALFYIFFNNHPIYYLIVLVLLFLAFLFASRKVRKEEKTQANLDFWKIWKRGLPILITGLILVISLVYYFSPNLMEMRQFEFKISRNAFDVIIGPLSKLISERLPEGMSLDANANLFLRAEEKQDLKNKYGVIIEANDTGKDVLYKLVDYQLNNVTGPYRKFIPFGLVVGLFIVLKIVSILYVALVILFSWLVLKLLIVTKFINIGIEKKEVETVKL
jgi:hypothetical protein